MTFKEFIESLKSVEKKEELKAIVEVNLEKLIEANYEGLKKDSEKKLADLIPGEKFDAIGIKALDVVLETIKAKLLLEVEKISDKV